MDVNGSAHKDGYKRVNVLFLFRMRTQDDVFSCHVNLINLYFMVMNYFNAESSHTHTHTQTHCIQA